MNFHGKSSPAYAKFILAGEYFVVFGGTCLAISCDAFYTEASVLESSENSFHCSFSPELSAVLDVERLQRYEKQGKHLLFEAQRLLDWPEDKPLTCELFSSIPPEQGAGSSSATCQALISALFALKGQKNVHPNYLEWFSKRLEHSLHRPISGIDNAIIAHGGAILFGDPNEARLTQVHNKAALHFILASTGPRRMQAPTLQLLKELQQQFPKDFQMSVKLSNSIVHKAHEAFVNAQAPRLGEAMKEAHVLLQHLRVSTQTIDEAVRAALLEGAFGAKVCGAGHGGFVIANALPDRLPYVEKVWRSLGLQSIRYFSVNSDS